MHGRTKKNHEWGDSLLKYRKENNLTQKVLADRLGITTNSICRWEKGAVPHYAKWGKIADVVGFSPTDYMEEVSDAVPETVTTLQLNFERVLSIIHEQDEQIDRLLQLLKNLERELETQQEMVKQLGGHKEHPTLQ